MPLHWRNPIRMAFMAVVLLPGLALAPAAHSETTKETGMTKITVTVGEDTLTATLDDTPAGRDFAKLLPLDLTLRDFHAIEKIADLPRELDTTGAPARYAAKTGDITLYAPWGNIAIFYKPFQAASGLVRLGAFDGPIDALVRDKPFQARFERAD